ncbi:MAG: sigma-70 family RNA polymerase sigma factor [Salibacteraceae bacterium]|jgi:RNA polymerase sigma factor (sigma-70 family)|nr:sigma-70 family RNA polymerase sigma factor [Salibacteraceae bacterium]
MEDKNLSDRAKRDLDLVDSALSGSQRAYTQLLSAYRENIYFMMFKMVNNRDDAEDLTIEAFGKAFKRLDQYRPDFAFSTWLFKIASNNCIDFLRKKKKATLVSLDQGYSNEDGDESTIDIEEDNLNPEQAFMKEQRKEEMHKIVDQLKPKYKQLVELRYFNEMSYEEIADELSLPLGTVKAQLFRARDLMYEILKHTAKTI